MHLRELARYPHVLCKLSGLVTEADWAQWTVGQIRPYAEIVFEAFGPHRAMFGSDWPVCLLAAGYRQVLDLATELTAGLAEHERTAVFGASAKQVYRL